MKKPQDRPDDGLNARQHRRKRIGRHVGYSKLKPLLVLQQEICADCAVVAYPRSRPRRGRPHRASPRRRQQLDRQPAGHPPRLQSAQGLTGELQAENPTAYGLASVGMDYVDPVSMAYEIWRHASDTHPDLSQRVASLPNIVYSTKHATDTAPDTGVLVHTQTVAGADAFAFVEPNGQAGRVTPQEALRLAECDPSTPSVQRLDDHHDLVPPTPDSADNEPIIVGAMGLRRQ